MSWTQKLKLALARGDYSTTDTIFKKLGLPVSALDNDTNEPIIYIAIEYYQNELLQKLLHTEELILMMQHGSNTNNILTTAIKHSNEQVVDYIISKTGKKLLGLANKAGVTPLLLACQMKNYRIVQKLLQAGSSITERDNEGSGPLHHALSWGNHQTAVLLLKAGSDPFAKNNKGWTSMDYCYNSKLHEYILECVKALSENKSMPVFEEKYGSRDKSVVSRNSFLLGGSTFIKLPSLASTS